MHSLVHDGGRRARLSFHPAVQFLRRDGAARLLRMPHPILMKDTMHLRHLFLVLAWLTSSAWAQHQHTQRSNPYGELQSRDIKALSPEQVADLREGRGMGASLPAEMNGVPGPLHVLELKERLKVTPQQQAALQGITEDMKAAAQRLGEQVIAAEGELDRAFKTRTADEKIIREATGRIASLNGELRATHLVAHLRTRQLLTDQQVTLYNVARGYAEAPRGHRH